MRLGSVLAAVVVAGAAASGCGLNQEGITPPKDRIFYPGAIALDPLPSMARPGEPHWLYVLNSNADLRFNDGTLVVVDLDSVYKVRQSALSHPDPNDPNGKPRDPAE